MQWIKNPSTGTNDTMLSLAVWGFGFSLGITTCSLIYLMTHEKDLSGLNNVAVLIGTILAPTIGAYTARKWTDSKYSGGESVQTYGEAKEQGKEEKEEENLPPIDPSEEGKEGA